MIAILSGCVLLVGVFAATRGRPQQNAVDRIDVRRRGSTELGVYTAGQKYRSWAQPLQDPRFLPASSASAMRPKDPVVGFRENGRAWAIPWWVLKNHHVANLDLDGKPYLVTFCERCTGAAAFEPIVDGKRLRFRIGGSYKGTPLLVDDETGSYWDIFDGQAFQGTLAGRSLPERPLVQSVWKDWVAANPETLVVDGAGERRDGHSTGHYPGDPHSGHGLGDTILELDDRLPPATLVLGVTVGATSRCYPLAELDSRGGVVEDVVGGQRIVAVKRPGSLESLAFERSLDGEDVTLRFDEGKLVDTTSGSRFDMFGDAVDGALSGKKLAFVRSGIEEFNTWAAHHPGAEIFGWAPEKGVAAVDSRE